MLKREIKYTNFNDEEVTGTFYFNVSKREIILLEADHRGGIEGFIKRITEAEDNKALVAEFEKIVLLAYGVRSDDGKDFIKTQEGRDKFVQSAAYDALFIELLTDENAAVEFMKGILPKDMQAEIAAEEAKKPLAPPNIQPVVKEVAKAPQERESGGYPASSDTPTTEKPADAGLEG